MPPNNRFWPELLDAWSLVVLCGVIVLLVGIAQGVI